MKKLIAFFTNRVTVLQRKSTNVFNVFNKTVSKLEKINVKIEAEKIVRQEKMKLIQIEHDLLLKTQEENEKIRTKISEFFGK